MHGAEVTRRRRTRAIRRAEEKRARTRDELAELESRYTRAAVATALEAVATSRARARRRTA